MSALAAWDVVPLHAPTRDRRSHLRLVPPVGARARSSVRPAALRLTHAGRLVLGLVLAIVALLVVAGAVGASRPVGTESRLVTVQAGQTLSELAVTLLPELSIAEGVAQLQLANGLNTPAIHAGQRLVVPTLP
jgi:LysM repeat protein